VAGSDLVWLLAQRAARDGRSIYLLGGAPGTAEGAAIELTRRCPGLRIAGLSSPRLPERPTSKELVPIASELREKQPDLVYIALGMPKGEFLIHELRATLPNAWWIGIGISLSFITGAVRRAPQWMQRSGLEWIHRLWQEPSRLARRYLRDDLPFAFRLFALALEARGAHQSGNR
jgi:N-acetylglucosaminyldiphosphoundecaprenol N-acetyl-beta-D-mannosaminyltransferase